MATALFTLGAMALAGPSGLGFAVGTLRYGAIVMGGTMLGAALDRQIFAKDQHASGPQLQDLHVTTASPGTHIPEVYGRGQVPGAIIWGKPLEQRSRTIESSSGGKGGGGGSSSTTVNYAVGTFAVLFGRGPLTVNRIYADGKLLWESGVSKFSATSLTVYLGTETQEADPVIQAEEGVANTPAYRGLCYAVFEDVNLEKFGNRVPNLTADVTSSIDTVQEIINDVCSRCGLTEKVNERTQSTFTSVSASNAASTITFGGGDPVQAGYRVGDVLHFSGLGALGSSNPGPFTITGFSGTSNRVVAVTPAPTTMSSDTSFAVWTREWESYGFDYACIGYSINTASTGRDIIQNLLDTYQGYAVLSDKALRFRHLSGTSSVTIPWGDLGAALQSEQQGEPKSRFDVSQTPTNALPRIINVNHADPERDMQVGTQQYRISATGGAQSNEVYQTPVALTGKQAAELAAVLIQRAWIARETCQFSLTDRYTCLDPGDVVTISDPDGDFVCLITQVSYNPDGVISYQGHRITQDALTPYSEYQPTALNATPLWGPAGTVLQLLDIPLLDAVDGTNPIYAGVYGSNPGWDGGAAFLETSQVLSFQDQAWVGEASTVLPVGVARVTDGASTVEVVGLSVGTLSSVSPADLWTGLNWFAVQSGTEWEILAAETCTLGTNGRWTLSLLHRGLLGTEAFMTGHAIGDRVVLLNAAIEKYGMAIGDRGVAKTWRGVTVGENYAAADSQSTTWQARSLRPLPPINLRTSRIADGGVILIWFNQTRGGLASLQGDWQDDGVSGSDLPLNEQESLFDIKIYTSAAGTTVKRTIANIRPANWYIQAGGVIDNPNYLYTAALQTTDFGSVQGVVYWQVWQKSAVVGLGQGSGIVSQ